MSVLIGLGCVSYRVAIYIANRPSIDHYPQLATLQALAPGELAHIVAHTSNHWRKAFNVYAKILCDLHWYDEALYASWQDYRDQQLLQHASRVALLFSPPDLSHSHCVHIIAGKTYAQALALPIPFDWLNRDFAINREHRVIVSPYLDYRQLSNARIEYLVSLVNTLMPSESKV